MHKKQKNAILSPFSILKNTTPPPALPPKEACFGSASMGVGTYESNFRNVEIRKMDFHINKYHKTRIIPGDEKKQSQGEDEIEIKTVTSSLFQIYPSVQCK